MEDAEQTQNRNKEDWIDALSRSTDKPRMQCAMQGHSHGVTTNPTLSSLKEIPLSWKENVVHTGSSSDYKSILENGLWARG